MMDDVEARIGTALRDLVPEPRPRAGLAELVQSTARRNRRRRWSGAGAVLGVVLVAGGLSANGLAHRDSLPSGPAAQDDAGPLVPAPPAVNPKTPHLVLSPSTVPRSGAALTVTSVNPTARALSYGLPATLDRWNGTSWTPYRKAVIGMANASGASSLFPLDATLTTPAIGISAPAHGSGAVLQVRLPPLPAGFYRLSQDFTQGQNDSHGKGDQTRGRLNGIFEVRPSDGPLSPPPAVDTHQPNIQVSPAQVRSGGQVTLTVVNPLGEEITFNHYGTVDRWAGAVWQQYRGFSTEGGGLTGGGLYDLPDSGRLPDWARKDVRVAAPPHSSSVQLHLPLPELPPGLYRFNLGAAVGIFEVQP